MIFIHIRANYVLHITLFTREARFTGRPNIALRCKLSRRDASHHRNMNFHTEIQYNSFNSGFHFFFLAVERRGGGDASAALSDTNPVLQCGALRDQEVAGPRWKHSVEQARRKEDHFLVVCRAIVASGLC